MTNDQPDKQEPQSNSLIISYLTMRKIVGWLGICLAPVPVLGTLILDQEVKRSVSAYYHSSMGDAFVGIICGIALFLFSYHGYSRQDSLASKSAGFFALTIAFFPTSVSGDWTVVSIIHYAGAAIFFVILSYMSIALFTKSSGKMTPEKKQRNEIYRVCGIIMLASVAAIPLSGVTAIKQHISFLKPTLIFETLALLSFGLSWLTKGEFLLKDK